MYLSNAYQRFKRVNSSNPSVPKTKNSIFKTGSDYDCKTFLFTSKVLEEIHILTFPWLNVLKGMKSKDSPGLVESGIMTQTAKFQLAIIMADKFSMYSDDTPQIFLIILIKATAGNNIL